METTPRLDSDDVLSIVESKTVCCGVSGQNHCSGNKNTKIGTKVGTEKLN